MRVIVALFALGALCARRAAGSTDSPQVFCDGAETFYLSDGQTQQIADHTGGGTYRLGMDCVWQIIALSSQQVVRIEFSYFNSEPRSDKLTVCDTGESSDQNVMAIVSGNQTGTYGAPRASRDREPRVEPGLV